VDFQNPTDQDFEQFCSVMKQLKEVPVHVHCIANYRVSAFFYRYRRDVLGMDATKALARLFASTNLAANFRECLARLHMDKTAASL
jgi:hypothetical protein